MRAFEASALDYLLKPIERPRLQQAMHKALTALPNDKTLMPTEQVFVREGERCWFVKLGDIRLFESEGNYTRLYFADEHPLLQRSLNQLAARLDPHTFFRASRKHIVNLNCIERIAPAVNGGFTLWLTGGLQVEVSRRQAQAFKEWKSL